MATPLQFDGARLLSWARRASDELNRRRVEINELNVFPVPDADTGSNMAHTMAAAVEEASALPAGADVRQVAEALAVGAVKGARGNSGVVLSQVIRGIAQTVSEDVPGGTVIADALRAAVVFVDRAIADPVEGTVITVLRAASVAAAEAAASAADPTAPTIEEVAGAATAAARVALANTPSQLEVLREAGVVDAGGTGLVVLLEALTADPGPQTSGGDSAPEVPAQPAHGEAGNLEVMFMFTGDLEQLEEALAELGDSLVVARVTATRGKVHIHSCDAGAVIEQAYGLGEVSDLRLEVLPPEPVTHARERLILAVTPPGSLTDLYQEAGAATVAPGEQVVEEILTAIHRCGASEVILLPNGLLGRRALAAVEKAARAFEQTVTLLPTVRLVSGIAALSVHDADQPLATAAFEMSEAAGEMRTAVVQERDLGALTPAQAVEQACTRLLADGGEQVTVFYDAGRVDRGELDRILARPRVEFFAFPADGLGALAEIGVE